MRLTLVLLAVLAAGGYTLWRWERARWRRALTSEQLRRGHDRLAVQAQVVELRNAMDAWADAAAHAIEEHGNGRGLEELQLLLWEQQSGWEDTR